MALKDYTIKFTDSSIAGKSDIVVYENSINDTGTTLALYGYGHKDYGSGLWENMLHIMENFASSSTAPAYPTIGQLWYNSGKKSLLIYVGTDDDASSNGWKNIVSNYDFSNNVSSGTPVVQYLTKSDLVGYLTPEVSTQLTGNLVLKNNDAWYTTVDNIVRLDSSVTIPGNYAASVRYVNVKVDTVVTEKLTTMANTGNNVSADSVNTSLSDYDTTGSPVGSNHLYIRRAKNSPVESRTMYDTLILPAQSAAVISGDDNYAATKGFVRSVLSTSKSTVNSSSSTTSSSTSTSTTGNYLPVAGGTLTGKLYLVSDETGYSDTNKNRAATRAYVDAKVGTGNTTSTSTTSTSTVTTDIISPADKTFTDAEKLNNQDRELISYTKFPDGTLIVYGFYRKFGVSYKDNGYWASSLSKITFPDGIKFTNNYYAVTITEEIPTVTMSPQAPSGKAAIAPTTFKSCDTVRRSGLWSDFNAKYVGLYKFRGAEILNKESDLKLTYIPKTYNQPVTENYNVANNSLWDKHWVDMDKANPGGKLEAIHPVTFNVFEKEQDGFRISALGPHSMSYIFWRNFVACNFTAIGRWK